MFGSGSQARDGDPVNTVSGWMIGSTVHRTAGLELSSARLIYVVTIIYVEIEEVHTWALYPKPCSFLLDRRVSSAQAR